MTATLAFREALIRSAIAGCDDALRNLRSAPMTKRQRRTATADLVDAREGFYRDLNEFNRALACAA